MRRDQHPEPFWRAARNCWFVQIGGKQIKLHPDRDEAYRRYHELMSKPPAEQKAAINPLPSGLVVELLDAFVDWARKNKAPRTADWYKENIQKFVDSIPPTLTIAELKPYHVTCAMDAHPHWGNNTRHDFISAVKRAFSWALDEEIIDRSPLARMKKPAREAREDALSPAEYAEVMAMVTEPTFRDLLEMAWETGARPQELRKLEARFFDAESNRIVFSPKHAKGKKYYRTIYLTKKARQIVARLAEDILPARCFATPKATRGQRTPSTVPLAASRWSLASGRCSSGALKPSRARRVSGSEASRLSSLPRRRRSTPPKSRRCDCRTRNLPASTAPNSTSVPSAKATPPKH